MRPRFIGTVLAVWLWLLSSGCADDPQSQVENMKAKDTTVNEVTTINGRIFADQQNSSYLPVSGRITGDELWHLPGTDSSVSSPALALGLHGNQLVASYGNVIEVMDRSDGKREWSNQSGGNHAFMIDDSGIITLDHAGFLHLIGYDGKLIEEMFLANVSNNTYLYFLHRSVEAAWLVSENYPTPTSTPEDKPLPTVARYTNFQPEPLDVRWEYTLPPKLLGVVLTRDLKRVFVADAERMITFPADAVTDDAVIEVEFAKIRSLATDGAGNVLVVDITEDIAQLKHVTPAGEINWELLFESNDVSTQPPASSPDGLVYIVVHNTLHQVKDGDLMWSYPLKAKTNDIKITVLADNSVLVAAGTALVHVSATGEEILTKWLNTTIRTRPIMDENGRVYFGADDGIHCLK